MTAVLPVSRGTDRDVPPYESTVAVKGWRFELDHERLEKSDTWALARSQEVRAWLLMMWLTAWRQTPAGSMPNDDELLCAHVGFTPEFFAQNRRTLMRGWRLASDGRLYHDVIVAQVLGMLATKKSERDRKAEWREKQEKLRAAMLANQGDSNSVPRDRRGKDATGTGTGTGTRNPINPKEPTVPRARVENGEVDLLGDAPSVPADLDDGMPPCPAVEILAAYHRLCPMLPRVSKLNAARRSAMRARWREDPEWQSLAWWERFFAFIAKSKFLTGRADPSPGKAPFVADIDFILRPSKFIAIIEGKYS